jgi:hypothetical protein
MQPTRGMSVALGMHPSIEVVVRAEPNPPYTPEVVVASSSSKPTAATPPGAPTSHPGRGASRHRSLQLRHSRLPARRATARVVRRVETPQQPLSHHGRHSAGSRGRSHGLRDVEGDRPVSARRAAARVLGEAPCEGASDRGANEGQGMSGRSRLMPSAAEEARRSARSHHPSGRAQSPTAPTGEVADTIPL